MKKLLLISCAMLLALYACNKDVENLVPDEGAKSSSLTFKLEVRHPGADTRAVKTGWEDGDAVFVFFSGSSAPKYLKMNYLSASDSWDYVQMDGDAAGSLELPDGSNGTMTAVYLPFGGAFTVSADGSDYRFSETRFSYYLTATQNYSVADGVVYGVLDMKIPDGYMQFYVDDDEASADGVIELREPHLTPVGVESVSADGTVVEATLAHGAPMPGYLYEQEGSGSKGYLFSGLLADDARNTSTDYHFTLVSGGFSGDYYHKAYTGKTFYRGDSEGRAVKLPTVDHWTAYTDFIPVDVGCDSHLGGKEYKRVYWANRNLGATADTGTDSYGDFFAWGEVEPYYEAGYARETPGAHWREGKGSGYAWASYIYNPSGDGSTFTKYTGEDYAVLQPEDDAATQLLGGLWRIPTNIDWKCLYFRLEEEYDDGVVGQTKSDAIEWIWNESGTAGYTVSSVAGGSSGNSIFLPLAGHRNNANLYSYKTGKESGAYWTSSLHYGTDLWDQTIIEYHPQYGFGASIDRPSDTGMEPLILGNYGRAKGRSIRPVMD